jgi:hypothetical protein
MLDLKELDLMRVVMKRSGVVFSLGRTDLPATTPHHVHV